MRKALSKQGQLRDVYKFSKYATMNFRPAYHAKAHAEEAGIISRVTSMFSSIVKPRQTQSEIAAGQSGKTKRRASAIGSVLEQIQKKKEKDQSAQSLKFLEKISDEAYLIGTQDQLDLVCIHGISQNYLETELNWSLCLHKPILHLAIDPNKSLIALIAGGQLVVYKYDLKNLRQPPSLLCNATLKEQPLFLQCLKDRHFAVVGERAAGIYQVELTGEMHLIFNRRYAVEAGMKVYQVPRPVDYVLNIFFLNESEPGRHNLWRLELPFKMIQSNHTFAGLTRIYEIPSSYLGKFTLHNYTPDLTVLNFTNEILIAREGYVLDSINEQVRESNQLLYYLGDRFVHIRPRTMGIYSFAVDLNSRPAKIRFGPLDEIELGSRGEGYVFLGCLDVLRNNYALFFAKEAEFNDKTGGEVDYLLTVSQTLSFQQKIDQIFTFRTSKTIEQIAAKRFSLIQEKCSIAFKFGLSRRDVFLSLWNKSKKNSLPAFRFLLDTMDYPTIRQEIEKKLKRLSMEFKEVYKIEAGCCELLAGFVFSEGNCHPSHLQQYISSHFLMKKLEFYRDAYIMPNYKPENKSLDSPPRISPRLSMKIIGGQLLREEDLQESRPEEERPKINIQQYVECTEMELQSQFVESAYRLCFEGRQQEVRVMRVLLRNFRLIFRLNYRRLLTELVSRMRSKLQVLLVNMPEILPYRHVGVGDEMEQVLTRGVWGDITPEEWKDNLFLDKVTTIYNRTLVTDLTKQVWFKRHHYSLHGLIPTSRAEVEQTHLENQSSGLFYFFIGKVLEQRGSWQDEVVRFVEHQYYNYLPLHLHGKISLYQALFRYLQKEKHSSSNYACLESFLALEQASLMRQFFDHEKRKKGCLLQDVKSTYQQFPEGRGQFNEAMLRFFQSELSDVSDLKYILNRLNSEKTQFHTANQQLYGVLVQATQMKITLGTDSDVPLEEIMIYLENIPVGHGSPILEELKLIQRIGEEADRFKRMRLGRSMMWIIENSQLNLEKMVEFSIKSSEILLERDPQQIKEMSYTILAELQVVKEKIYKDQYTQLIYFSFISKLMEEEELIPAAGLLLEDEYLLQYYAVDQRIIQDLVLYMYKWRMNEQPVFALSQSYIQKLITLLPPDSEGFLYIHSELELAMMLHCEEHPITYPLTENETISIAEIHTITQRLSLEHLLGLDLAKLHQDVCIMQQLSLEIEVTTLTQIHEAVIMRLLELKAYKEVIGMLRRMKSICKDGDNYLIAFCLDMFGSIFADISDNHKERILKLTFYTFTTPSALLDCLEERFNTPLSNIEEEQFIDRWLQKVRGQPCFNTKNPLLDSYVLELLSENEIKYYALFEDVIFQTWRHLQYARDDFRKQPQFTFYLVMMLHQPETMAKYLSIKKDRVNLRLLRSFLSYLHKEDIFNGTNVLLLARRLTLIVLTSEATSLPVNDIISEFNAVETYQDEDNSLLTDSLNDPYQLKLQKSVKVLTKKIKSLLKKSREPGDRRKQRIDALLNQEASLANQGSEYPFNDSDDNYDQKQEDVKELGYSLPPTKKRQFTATKERSMIMKRQSRNLTLLLSSSVEDFQLRMTSPGMLQRKKSIQGPNLAQTKKRLHRNNTIMDKIKDLDRRNSLEVDDRIKQEDGMVDKPVLLRASQILIPHEQYSNSHRSISAHSSPTKGEIEWEDNMKRTVSVQQQIFTPLDEMTKALFANSSGAQKKPIFKLTPLAEQADKNDEHFAKYLRALIEYVYNRHEGDTSAILCLIKQIVQKYPQSKASTDNIETYLTLQSNNVRHNMHFHIRQVFPVEGIFLESTNPMDIFHCARDRILEKVDYEQMLLMSKLLGFALRKPEIKAELVQAYLQREITLFGQEAAEQGAERQRQLERIDGLMKQVSLTIHFIDQAEKQLKEIKEKSRREEVLNVMREVLTLKKKQYLARQLEKRLL